MSSSAPLIALLDLRANPSTSQIDRRWHLTASPPLFPDRPQTGLQGARPAPHSRLRLPAAVSTTTAAALIPSSLSPAPPASSPGGEAKAASSGLLVALGAAAPAAAGNDSSSSSTGRIEHGLETQAAASASAAEEEEQQQQEKKMVHMEGFLLKKSYIAYRARYFLLDGSNLLYKATKDDTRARNLMTLSTDSQVVEFRVKRGACCGGALGWLGRAWLGCGLDWLVDGVGSLDRVLNTYHMIRCTRPRSTDDSVPGDDEREELVHQGAGGGRGGGAHQLGLGHPRGHRAVRFYHLRVYAPCRSTPHSPHPTHSSVWLSTG